MIKVFKSFIKRFLEIVLAPLVLEKFPAERSPHCSHPDRYQQIFETRPVAMPKKCDVELHMLVCERDYLRSFWALKSFYYYSGIAARLVIQNDGSLTDEAFDRYHEHFPGCVVNTNVST
jgi:hypothetical protein